MDPNKVIKPGTVETAWITTDGTYITTDAAEAKKNGATHQVAASKATYADGRRQWIVYTGPDRSLAEGTYSPAGPVAGYDEDVQRAWQQQQAGAQRQTDQAERKRVSVTYEGSGKDRKRRTVYESGPDLVEDAPETTTTRTPEKEAEDKAAENERVWNEANGPGKPGTSPTDAGRGSGFRETHLERREREAKEKKEAEASTPKPHITMAGGDLVSIDPATNKVTVLRAGAEEGKTYSVGNRIIQIKDGKATVLYEGAKDPETIDIGEGRKGTVVKGPNGEVTIREVPVQAVPRPAGPSIPTFVVGQAAAALRAGFEQINAEVAAGRQTPAWGEARKKEMLEVANVAKDEAATAQREQESSRAAQVNLATTKATALSNGFTTALTIVSKLNDSLPEGSTLGGQMFAALLGINMLNLKASGIYDIQPPGTPVSNAAAQPALPPPPPNMADKAAVAAYQAAVAAQVKAAQAPATPAAAAAPAAPVSATATTPARPAAAPPGSAEPPARANLPPMPAQTTSGNEAPDDILTVRDPRGGGTVYMTRSNWDASPPESRASYTVVNAENGAAFAARTGGAPNQATQWDASVTVTPPPMKQEAPPADIPPVYPDSYPVTPKGPVWDTPLPSSYGDAQDTPTSRAAPQPYQQFAALNTVAAPMTAPTPLSMTPSALSQGLPPAVLHAQAAATPPWRLDDTTIAQMQAAGVPDDVIWSVPKVAV